MKMKKMMELKKMAQNEEGKIVALVIDNGDELFLLISNFMCNAHVKNS